MIYFDLFLSSFLIAKDIMASGSSQVVYCIAQLGVLKSSLSIRMPGARLPVVGCDDGRASNMSGLYSECSTVSMRSKALSMA
jgi:hypothetical protein